MRTEDARHRKIIFPMYARLLSLGRSSVFVLSSSLSLSHTFYRPCIRIHIYSASLLLRSSVMCKNSHSSAHRNVSFVPFSFSSLAISALHSLFRSSFDNPLLRCFFCRLHGARFFFIAFAALLLFLQPFASNFYLLSGFGFCLLHSVYSFDCSANLMFCPSKI